MYRNGPIQAFFPRARLPSGSVEFALLTLSRSAAQRHCAREHRFMDDIAPPFGSAQTDCRLGPNPNCIIDLTQCNLG